MKNLIAILLLFGLAIYIWRREYPVSSAKHQELPAMTQSENPNHDQQIAEIQKHRQRIVGLESQLSLSNQMAAKLHNDIADIRSSLNAADPAAVAKLNSRVSACEKVSERTTEISSALATEKRQLNTLLAEADSDAVQAAIAPPAATPAPYKRVVVYSTTNCPICMKVKSYLVKKGVFYSDLNIEKSPTDHKEFKRLGGESVPLTVIGDKLITGYDEVAIDRALQ